MGVVAPLRYVMITDGMLEQLDDTKIEAVFGHEAGHVKRHHILFFLMLAFVSGCWITILSIYGRYCDPVAFQLLVALGAIVLVIKWGVLFGWISRRFERQADVFGVRTLALAGVPCQAPCIIHGNLTAGASRAIGTDEGSVSAAVAGTAPVAVLDPPVSSGVLPAALTPRELTDGNRLCATAAHIFGDTLNEVAVLNGIPPEARSWRHSSIASRSRFVQKLAREPETLRRFESSIIFIKRGIIAAAAGSAAWAAWELKLWTLLQGWTG
jgi:STE24 endopeptidase